MLVRNLLLIVGALAILAGASIGGYLWLSPKPAVSTRAPDLAHAIVLVAARPLPSGSVVQRSDLTWQALETRTPPPDSLAQGQVSAAQFVGSVTRRDLAAGEVIAKNTLIDRDDTKGLAAMLSPGYRAVTIDVDAAQGGAGLILPGDRVDVILVSQTTEGPAGAASAARRSGAALLLRDIRVAAVDRATQRPNVSGGPSDLKAPDANASGPKTITLEVTDKDARRVLLATQAGKIELSLRSLAHGSGPAGDGAAGGDESLDDSAPTAVAGRRRLAGAPLRREKLPRSELASGRPIVILRGSKANAP
jgi:pilus assembly protein CpaB